MIASCGFLENELRQFSSEEGVTLADRVETLGVDKRTRVKRLGAKEKARRKKRKVRFSLIKKNKAFQKSYMKVGVKKLLRTGMMPARTWRVHAVEMSSHAEVEIEKTDGRSGRKKRTTSLSLFCSWKHTALLWKMSFPPRPLSIGQEFGLGNGVTSKKKHG